jgi:hypothetical protein
MPSKESQHRPIAPSGVSIQQALKCAEEKYQDAILHPVSIREKSYALRGLQAIQRVRNIEREPVNQ